MTWQMKNFASNLTLNRVGFAMSITCIATRKSHVMEGFPGT